MTSKRTRELSTLRKERDQLIDQIIREQDAGNKPEADRLCKKCIEILRKMGRK